MKLSAVTWHRNAAVLYAGMLIATVATGLTPTAAGARDLVVGGAAIVRPKYEGSNHYEVTGAPIIYPVFESTSSGTLSINDTDDVRWRLLENYGFEAGVLGGYAFGRDEDDGRRLAGIGDIDAGLVLGGYVGYRIAGTLFDVSYHRIVTGDTGGYFRFGASHNFYATPFLELKLRVAATYADDDYMQDHFGITGWQARHSRYGLRRYDADSGFKDVHVHLSGKYNLTDSWAVVGGVGYKRLVGDARNSPIVESDNQFLGTLGLTYRFGR